MAVDDARKAILCELAGKLFDTWAARRIELVKTDDDLRAYTSEMETYLSMIVMPCLADVDLSDAEMETIRLSVAGRKQHWLGRALEWTTPADAKTPTGVKSGITRRRSAPPTEAGRRTKPAAPHTALQVCKWGDIAISFLSEERVQIRSGDQTETCNYAELGFEDGRKGTPRRAWTILQLMAKSEGKVKYVGDTTWPAVEKRVQEIRRILRGYFGISDDPIPYVEGHGYSARFKIDRRRSYNS
jgi:hypothetical protein